MVMVQPTPWTLSERAAPPGGPSPVPVTHLVREQYDRWRAVLVDPQTREQVEGIVQRTLEQVNTSLARARKSPSMAGAWGYAAGLLGNAIVLILLFCNWLSVMGANGTASINAFARIAAATKFLDAWSDWSHKGLMNVTGAYGIATAALSVFAIAVHSAYLFSRSETFARLCLLANIGVTAGVLTTLLYLSTLFDALRAIVKRRFDTGGNVASVVYWFTGDGILPIPNGDQVEYVATATYQVPAMAALAITILSLVAVAAQRISNGQRLFFGKFSLWARLAAALQRSHLTEDSTLPGPQHDDSELV